MTDLRIDMLAGHAILSRSTGVSTRSIKGALQNLKEALALVTHAVDPASSDRHRTTSLQIVRYVADCVQSADLESPDDPCFGHDEPLTHTNTSVQVLRLVDPNHKSIAIDIPEQNVVVEEAVFTNDVDLQAYCWSDHQWDNECSETCVIIRGFVGGLVYLIRLGCMPAKRLGQSSQSWMDHFRSLVEPCLADGPNGERFSHRWEL